MKKLFGAFLVNLSNVLNVIFTFLIDGMSIIVNFLSGISSILLLLGVFVLFLGFWMIPLMLIFVFNPIFWIVVFVFFILPSLGKGFISVLKYANYTFCEYLTDYGNYLLGNRNEYKSFKDFSAKYEQMQEEKMQRQREERQRMEREAWESRFREWEQFFNNNQTGGYYNYGNGNGNYGNYQNYKNYTNPYEDFKSKFEKCCRTLEIENYNADFYEIKLQYRKLAKKYHPDLNPNEDTTAKFQEINSAFEFLTEENIKRYREISRN